MWQADDICFSLFEPTWELWSATPDGEHEAGGKSS